jgi:hypothetical protein
MPFEDEGLKSMLMNHVHENINSPTTVDTWPSCLLQCLLLMNWQQNGNFC